MFWGTCFSRLTSKQMNISNPVNKLHKMQKVFKFDFVAANTMTTLTSLMLVTPRLHLVRVCACVSFASQQLDFVF